MFEEKGLRDERTDAARSEQTGHDGEEEYEENDQMAHRRMVAAREILRNHGQSNNSSATSNHNPVPNMKVCC
jgi:hypothetical protein